MNPFIIEELARGSPAATRLIAEARAEWNRRRRDEAAMHWGCGAGLVDRAREEYFAARGE